MSEEKFRELVRSRLTEEDVHDLFDSILDPLAEETKNQIISSVRAAAIRGENIYAEQYGDLFPLPIKNGEVRKLIMRKIVEEYNALPDRLFDIILSERED